MSDHSPISDLFLKACGMTPEERARFLEKECAGDAALLSEVMAMLAADGRAGETSRTAGLMNRVAAAAADLAMQLPELPLDRHVGPYRIAELVGEGGMGIVYRAEQVEPLRREVALKLIRSGFLSEPILARFESERQALALMSHPNIARVLDAGTTPAGTPYVAMEYVRGIPITRFCDDHGLGIERRLDLFLQVCDGVQHAHQKGVIHRDLKPSNILVEPGEHPTPKIIDFGVAKLIEPSGTGHGPFTRAGMIVGTPEYMSPEQADHERLDVDTRSDVYSLGALLYELLTGSHPLDASVLDSRNLDEIQRHIREVDPPKPSTRVGTADGTLAGSRGSRSIDSRSLSRRLRGDLDWITMKALEKDRSRRYGSPSELGSDIMRHVRHEPVAAGPPSAVYRLRKYVRRHRAFVAGAAAVVLVLLAGTTGTTVGLLRARRQADLARTQAAIARAVNTFLNEDLLSAVDPAKLGINATVRDVLDAAAKGIDGKFGGEPLVEADVRMTIGSTYFALGRLEDSEIHLRRALELRRPALGAGHPDTLLTQRQLGVTLFHRGRHAEAEAMLRDTLDGQRRLIGSDDPEIPITMTALAFVLLETKHPPGAAALAREALDAQRRLLGADHPDTLPTQRALAAFLAAEGQYEPARELLEEALGRQRRMLGPEHPATLVTAHDLARVYANLKRSDEAVAMLGDVLEIRRRVLGPDHPYTLASAIALAKSHIEVGRWETAEPIYLQVLEAQVRTFGVDSLGAIETKNQLAILYMTAGLPEKAGGFFREVLEARRRTVGAEHPLTLLAARNLAVYYIDTERPEEAVRLLRDVIDKGRRLFGEDDFDVWEYKGTLASLLLQMERFDEAAALYEEVLAYRRRALGDEQVSTQNAMQFLAESRQGQKRFDEAERLLVELLEVRRRVHGEDHESVGDALWSLGRHQVIKGAAAASRRYFDDALERKRSAKGEASAEFAFMQARHHALMGERDDALRQLRRAVALGYSQHRELLQHVDFVTVRDDPRFQRILTDVKRRNESTLRSSHPPPPAGGSLSHPPPEG